jgi:multiple sugar transport system ATP-binding protein
MNLVQGMLERGDGDAYTLRVGPVKLGIPESILAKRPALASYTGRKVVVGVRSEDMEDASLKPDSPTDRLLDGQVTLVEALGSEIVVHFDLEGESVVTDDTKEVAQAAGEEVIDTSGDNMVKWVASFAPRSRVSIGNDVKILVDVERMHWFDPETSEAIRT